MRRLQYTYSAIHRILTPFQIETETIQLPHTLHDGLCVLFPRKAPLFRQKSSSSATISFFPDAPFGPQADALIDALFPAFEQAVEEVRKYFDLSELRILKTEDSPGFQKTIWPQKFRTRDDRGLEMNAFEFYRLHSAAVLEKQTNSLLLSIYLNPNQKWCVHVPQGTPIHQIFSAIPEIQDYLRQHPNSRPYHPLLKRTIHPETDTADHETALIMFSGSGYTVAPADSVFCRFPYANRRIGVVAGDRVTTEALPCVNCLACSTYCPVGLFPSFLFHHLRQGNTDDALALQLQQCIRCGLCSFVCPSFLPLYDTFTRALHELQEDNV